MGCNNVIFLEDIQLREKHIDVMNICYNPIFYNIYERLEMMKYLDFLLLPNYCKQLINLYIDIIIEKGIHFDYPNNQFNIRKYWS